MNTLYKSILALLSFFVWTALLSGCTKESKDPLIISETYDTSGFSSNTAKEQALRTQLEALVAEMKKGRTPGVNVSADKLLALYTSGNPSLQAVATSYYNSLLSGSNGWIAALASASGQTYTPGGNSGGTYGAYLFSPDGIEPEQIIDKGLYGAAGYYRAVSLAQNALSPATVDQILCLYGAPPEFPNTNANTRTANSDKFMAGYAARRDKNDGKGLYERIKKGFLQLQAAVKAGPAYAEKQEEALEQIFQNWEKAAAATSVNYLYNVVSTMSATNPTDAQKAAALHAHSEAIAFVWGFRQLNSPFRIATDEQIDQVLTLLYAKPGVRASVYTIATKPVQTLGNVLQATEKIQEIYGFSEQEMEDFKKNWVAEQGR